MNLGDIDVMIRQADALPGDLERLPGDIDEQLSGLAGRWGQATHVYVVGSGDSYRAGCAAELAFEHLADARCRAVRALPFAEYAAPVPGCLGPAVLVIAVSASGTNGAAVRALERARERGALTLAVTADAESPLANAGESSVVYRLPGNEPSPGIRTYQASLVALFVCALHLAEKRGRCSRSRALAANKELVGLARAVHDTAAAGRPTCGELAEVVASCPTLAFVGSGPNYGTALYAAAKMIEAAGIPALGQELDEWWHVERFARPSDMPVVIISPPGASHARAGDVAEKASRLGRRVIAVTHDAESALARHASHRLLVPAAVREEFSPLLYHVFAPYLACRSAQKLGRHPFEAGRLPAGGSA